MSAGPAEVLILTFAGERVDPEVVKALNDVVDTGGVTLLDLVFATRERNGDLRVIEFDEDPAAFGFNGVEVSGEYLANDEDIAVVADTLEPGTSAAFIVYEHTWVRRVSEAIHDAGGQVALRARLSAEPAGAMP